MSLLTLDASRWSHVTTLTYVYTYMHAYVWFITPCAPMCTWLLVSSHSRRQSLPACRVCSRLRVVVLRSRFGRGTALYDSIERRHGL